MISGIFGKTKPINYIILIGFLFLFYWFAQSALYQKVFSPNELLLQTLVLLVLLFGILVLNFIVNRNQITNDNSYSILYFTLLIIIFPKAITDNNAIFANFFLMLASRRLISLKSLKEIKLKVLDATLWILVASLFYDWAILFISLVFIAIYIYEPKNIKNWLVPFVGSFAFGLLGLMMLFLVGNITFFNDHYQFDVAIDTTWLTTWEDGLKLLIFIAGIVITGALVFLKTRKLGLGRIINLRIMATLFALGVGVCFLKYSGDDYPFLITFFPAAVFLAKYVELIKRKNIKEIVLIGSIAVSFILLLTEVVTK